jgi:hypothetical protein
VQRIVHALQQQPLLLQTLSVAAALSATLPLLRQEAAQSLDLMDVCRDVAATVSCGSDAHVEIAVACMRLGVGVTAADKAKADLACRPAFAARYGAISEVSYRRLLSMLV